MGAVPAKEKGFDPKARSAELGNGGKPKSNDDVSGGSVRPASRGISACEVGAVSRSKQGISIFFLGRLYTF